MRLASPEPVVDLAAVREVSLAVTGAHRWIYFVPESAEEVARLGVTSRGPAYFALRSAAMGAVPWRVVLATFYDFSPRAARSMEGVWDIASPGRWQATRFVIADRAMRRVGVRFTADEIAEARSLIDPVVAGADYAGKPLAAANASVPLPPDPLVALWRPIGGAGARRLASLVARVEGAFAAVGTFGPVR